MTVKFSDIVAPSLPPLPEATKAPPPPAKKKKPAAPCKVVPEWDKKAAHNTVPEDICRQIERLRRTMLVHCYIYYVLGDSVICDNAWQHYAQQLTDLQAKYGTKFDFYDEEFYDWDASTGYHLRYDAYIRNKALWLLRLRDSGYSMQEPPRSQYIKDLLSGKRDPTDLS